MKIDVRFISDTLSMYRINQDEQSIIHTVEFGAWIKGETGSSAYEIATANGFIGTEQEWLNSLKGDGEMDYERLIHLPKINNTILTGNKTSEDLGLQPAGDYPEDELTNEDIHNILKR